MASNVLIFFKVILLPNLNVNPPDSVVAGTWSQTEVFFTKVAFYFLHDA